MVQFRNILFLVDMSESSSKIVPYVKILAELFEPDIHLLYVAPSVDCLPDVMIEQSTLNSFESEILNRAKVSLKQFKEKHFGNSTCFKMVVKRGYPSEEILKYVSKEKVDLIIMGTHGRKSLENAIFGSVAEQVVKTSSVPVLTINPHKIKAEEDKALFYN